MRLLLPFLLRLLPLSPLHLQITNPLPQSEARNNTIPTFGLRLKDQAINDTRKHRYQAPLTRTNAASIDEHKEKKTEEDTRRNFGNAFCNDSDRVIGLRKKNVPTDECMKLVHLRVRHAISAEAVIYLLYCLAILG